MTDLVHARLVCEAGFLGVASDGLRASVNPHVQGVGIGYKVHHRVVTKETSIQVYVKRKVHPTLLRPEERIPDEVEGVPTDVIETGIFAIGRKFPPIYQRRIRPAPGGVSIGHKDVSAGTFGALVREGGDVYILSNNHVLCVDEETEVLTKEGWKRWPHVLEEDALATLGPTGGLEYETPQAIHKSWYDGELIHFKSKFMDLLVTPSHRLYARPSYRTDPKDLSRRTRPRRNKAYGFVTAEEARSRMSKYRSSTYLMTSLCKWNGSTSEAILLPRVKYPKGKDHNIVTPMSVELWARFLGWYLSEGSCAISPVGEYIVSIRNSNQEYCAEIQAILEQMGFNAFISKSGRGYAVTVNSKQLYSYVKQFGGSGDKYLPSELKDCPPDILAAFLDTYVKGDGWRHRKYVGAVSKSKRLIDDLQEVFLKLGFHSSVRTTRGGYRPEREYHLITAYRLKETRVSKVTTVRYRGWVYCATVPNGILLVRRNGKPVWTGNSNENKAAIGDPILQPGKYDGGRPDRDSIAQLSDFVPLEPEATNTVDAAIATPIVRDDVAPEVLHIGRIKGDAEPEIDLVVRKSGRTTRLTEGRVTATDVTLRVWYSGGSLVFTDQFLISARGGFAGPGDSGSLVVDSQNRAVGLMFAGSPLVTVANRWANVAKALKVKPVS